MIESVIRYVWERWSLTVAMEKSLSGTYTCMLRRVVDPSWRYPSRQRRTVRRLSKLVRQDQIQKAWSYCPLPQVKSPRYAASQLALWLPDRDTYDAVAQCQHL